MLRLVHEDAYLVPAVGPYRFPVEEVSDVEPLTSEELSEQLLGDRRSDPRDMLNVVEEMSRRMEDLAKEFGCSTIDDEESDDDPLRAA
ncbi:MAG: hypothetical protein O7G85_14635 [Planctomycetota bacterium]|nr:hypothetical protein [Planctomycetota bacterium]